ncbi:MAG: CpsB/CapC family capsule biosynthesis tyrosine phosphatase [Candidatus Solibacter sp.]|jgi:protein-tyrosine phosphatase
MIDIHSHILPGLDDGSKSLEESVEMLRQAAAAGTTDIVASPHANQDYAFDPLVVERMIGELQAAVGDTPRIHYGCDFHLTLENIDDALRAPGKYSIDHRGYLLVEFSDFLVPKTSDQLFAQMIHVGLRPIVTHPERNQLLQRRQPELEAWVAQGVHLQVTAQSLLGRFGKTAKECAHELMGRGLVHFLASDAHDTQWRTTALDEARRYVDERFGPEAGLRMFVENPRSVLAGVPLTTVPLPIRRKPWYAFW